MKKKITALLLAVCLLLALSAPGTAAGDVCFLSLNDTLLELSSRPYWQDGVTYVPNGVFSTFGVYFSAIDTTSMTILSGPAGELYFNTVSGETYDNMGNSYEVSAIYHNGVVYMPLDFVCSYFGLSYSYIIGTNYGDLIRIKDSNVVLSDARFFSAATSLMKQRYNEYMAAISVPSPTPGGWEQPVITPVPVTIQAYLTFEGLPSEELLDVLDEQELIACFLLSPAQVRENAGSVRRLVGCGHTVGLLLEELTTAELEHGAELLFEAAAVPVTVIGAADADSGALGDFASKNGLAVWECGIDCTAENADYAGLVRRLDEAGDRADVRLSCGEEASELTAEILNYLLWNGYSLQAARISNCPRQVEPEGEVAA